MNIKIKGRNWWGKNPKNSWKAWDNMYACLRNKDNGVYDMSDRMTCEEWYIKNENVIHSRQLQLALWDWQNERVELLKRISDLEKENSQIVDLAPVCERWGEHKEEE